MARAGKSGGGSSSSSSSNRSGFSGGWSNSGRSSSSSSSSTKSSSSPSRSSSASKSSSTSSPSRNNSSGGWSSSGRTTQKERSISKPVTHNNSHHIIHEDNHDDSHHIIREDNHHDSHHHYTNMNNRFIDDNNQDTIINVQNVVVNNYSSSDTPIEVNKSEVNKIHNNTQTNKVPPKPLNIADKGYRMGCWLMVFIVIVFVFFVPNRGESSDGSIYSTVNRTALDSSKVVKTGYYIDELDWIKTPSVLTKGMESFYGKTGVQPALLITDNINGNYRPNNNEAKEYMEFAYNELFQDEGHVLVLFLEANDDHATWIYCGNDAEKVMDSEARDILYSNIEYEYYSDKTEEEMFATAFNDTADQIMTVHQSAAETLIEILLFLIIIQIILKYISKKIDKKKLSEATSNSGNLASNKEEDESNQNCEVVECPNCAADNKVKIGFVEKCEYCGTSLKG